VKKRREASTTLRMRVPRGTAPATRGACLVVIHGVRLGQCIDLHDVPVVIGRSAHSDFQIEHRSVSRNHCKVWHDNGAFFVRDLGSTNRTFLNERPIEQAELSDGDHVGVGDTVLKFVARGSLEARYHEALYELATIDSLTQLYNRRKFREYLEEAVVRVDGDGGRLALVFIDLDHFKAINETHGHSGGDEVLKIVSASVRQALRAGDIAGRLGGEEFAIIMAEADLATAAAYAEGLRQTLAALRCPIEGKEQRVSASIGVAAWSPAALTASELMREADVQLFRAKAAGRNRVCYTGGP
jgi:diguanylate cyclase (GGDEF)-like protein